MEPVWLVPVAWLLVGGALLALLAGGGLLIQWLAKRRIWRPGLRMFVLGLGMSAIGFGSFGILVSFPPAAPGWPWLLIGVAGVTLAFRISGHEPGDLTTGR